MNYQIDFDRFDETAQQIAHATGCGIITDLQQTGAIKPNAVVGKYTPRQAIRVAISNTNLKIGRETPNSIEVLLTL